MDGSDDDDGAGACLLDGLCDDDETDSGFEAATVSALLFSFDAGTAAAAAAATEDSLALEHVLFSEGADAFPSFRLQRSLVVGSPLMLACSLRRLERSDAFCSSGCGFVSVSVGLTSCADGCFGC